MYRIILFFIFSLTFCTKNDTSPSRDASVIDAIMMEDFKLENIYFAECKETELLCMTKQNAHKCIENIITLRKAFNEREQKFLLAKEVAANKTIP